MKKLSLLFISLILVLNANAMDGMDSENLNTSSMNASPATVEPAPVEPAPMKEDGFIKPIEKKIELSQFLKSDLTSDEKKTLGDLNASFGKNLQLILSNTSLSLDDKISKIKSLREDLTNSILVYVDSTKIEDFKYFSIEQTTNIIEKITKQLTSTSKNKEQKDDLKNKLGDLKKEKDSKIKENKEQIKQNWQDYKEVRGTGSIKTTLSDETKAKIKELMDSQKTQADSYRAMVSSGTLTKEEAMSKLEALRTSTYESIKALVGDNEEALKLVGMKKDMIEKNMELRKDNVQIRQDNRDKRKELISQYKEKFTKQLSSKLDSMDSTKLQSVLDKITKAIDSQKSKTKVNDKVLSQLEALQSLIQEKISGSNVESDLNVDELLK